MKKFSLILVPFLVLLSSCTNSDNVSTAASFAGGGLVKIVILDDGTKCAVTMPKGGIDCNWQ